MSHQFHIGQKVTLVQEPPTPMGPISGREFEASLWRQEKSELLAKIAKLRGELAAERTANQNLIEKIALYRGEADLTP